MDNTTRRQFFGSATSLLGATALGHVSALGSDAKAVNHFPATAQHVIYLFMSGGPSHVDLLDPKPELTRWHGKPIPESFVEDVHFAMIPSSTKQPKLHGSPFKFQQHGESGLEVSELLPHVALLSDRLAVVRSLSSTVFNHDPAVNFLNTGDPRVGRPTMGSWISYGLGNLTENLPAFVVMTSGIKRQPLLTSYWSSGFLPTSHQGVQLRRSGDPVLFLSNPDGVSVSDRRRQLDLINRMNQRRYANNLDPEVLSRIQQYETAFRMQTAAPEIMSLSDESAATLDQYGAKPAEPSFARNCLLARRMVESGVRFIQLYDMGWDSHGSLVEAHRKQCRGVDRAIAALISDLAARGLLERTLVIWGGEFGRTPVIQGTGDSWGRDHHPHGFSMWFAGGGFRPGSCYGATDEFGFHAQENRISVHDIHATILHTLGIDHTRFVYRHQGRDFRLTDVGGSVIAELLA